MRVSHIELENFKSFRGKHIVGPFREMTSVIGPNGCGKSNIVDSLTFAFDIENARNNHPISSLSGSQRPAFCSVEVYLSRNDGGGDDGDGDSTDNTLAFRKTLARSK